MNIGCFRNVFILTDPKTKLYNLIYPDDMNPVIEEPVTTKNQVIEEEQKLYSS